MSQSNDIYNQIEEYLQGQLSGQSLKDFEAKLLVDQELAMQVKMHQLAEEVVVDYKLNDLRKEIQKVVRRERNSYRKFYSISAIIIAAVGTLSYFIFINKNENSSSASSENNKVKNVIESKIDFIEGENLISKEKQEESSEFPNGNQNTPAKGFFNVNKETIPTEPNDQVRTTTQEYQDNNLNKIDEIRTTVEAPQGKSPDSIIDPCKKTFISFEAHSKGTCKDQNAGMIYLDPLSFKGGVPPYTYSIDESPYQVSLSFVDLTPGSYSIYVKDKSSCVSKRQVLVDEIQCKNEYALNPSMNEIWNIPVIDELDYSIKIFDQGGRIVYQNFVTGGNGIWDGHTNDGEDLPMGNYKYVIMTKSGKTQYGFISIFK